MSNVDIFAALPVKLTVCYAGWNETGFAVLRWRYWLRWQMEF